MTTAFKQFGTINHVRLEMPPWGPKAWDSAGDRYGPGGGVRYLIMHITFSEKAGAAAAVKRMNGFTFIGADVPRDGWNKAIEVRFASDQSYDYHDDDDYDDALHGYGEDTLDDGDPDGCKRLHNGTQVFQTRHGATDASRHQVLPAPRRSSTGRAGANGRVRWRTTRSSGRRGRRRRLGGLRRRVSGLPAV